MANTLGSRWPTIPEPSADPNNLYNSVSALREAMELITGQRGFDLSYSMDAQNEITTKTLNNLSATVSESIRVAVSENAALAERTSLVEAEIVAARAGEASLGARVVSVDTASVDRDGALSSTLTQVGVKADYGSAGGYFRMLATLSGGAAVAQLDGLIYTSTPLTGPAISAGFRVQIIGGQSYFDVYANTFRIIDTSGVAKTPLIYTAGKFTFTSDVVINGDILVNGTITGLKVVDLSLTTTKIADANIDTSKIAANAISNVGAAGGYGSITVYIYARAGSSVFIVGDVGGNNTDDTSTLFVNGVSSRVVTRIATSYSVGETQIFHTNSVPVNYTYVASYTGTQTMTLVCTSGSPTLYLFAVELAK